jgi:hypothetical protein
MHIVHDAPKGEDNQRNENNIPNPMLTLGEAV